MKPNSTPPGVPFNFDTIPLWVRPDLWDEATNVKYRGLWFVCLYTMSLGTFAAMIFFPLGLFFAKPVIVTTVVWLTLSIVTGIPFGLAVWWDFTRESRKIAAQEAAIQGGQRTSNSSSEDKKI